MGAVETTSPGAAADPGHGVQGGSEDGGASAGSGSILPWLERQTPKVRHPHKGRSLLLKVLCMTGDLTAIMLGLLVAYVAARMQWVPEARRPNDACIDVAIMSLPIWVVAFNHYRLYVSRFVSSRPNEVGRLMHAVVIGILGMATISFLFKLTTSRSWIVTSFFTVFVLCLLERQFVRFLFDTLRRRGTSTREVLLVGANAEAERIHRQLTSDPRLGYRIIGTISEDGARLAEVPPLGSTDDALAVALQAGVTGAIVATSALTSETLNRMVRQFANAGMHIELSSSLADVGAERLTVRPLGYFPMLYIEPVRNRGWRVAAKRAFDIVMASTALILLSPLLLAVAIWVKVDSRGPVFFRQRRVGRYEQGFEVLKFRTMVPNAEKLLIDLAAENQADGPLFKMKSDPRVTKAGAILRKYSIDELPQLVNVLKGEMSVVGPRPALFSEMAVWTPELRQGKLSVRPGLTGIWQVSGRSNLSFESYVRLDLFYVQNWSLWRDLAIVARTIPVVLKRDGAY